MNKYNIIYADPPWSYWAGGRKNAARHYDCMDIEDIYRLPVWKIAADNCALFMWATFPMLPECIETVKRWGFKYSTVAFVWIKHNKRTDSMFMGCGNYTRANAEICILAKKGHLKRLSKSVKQIIYAPTTKHSEKPAETRDRIIQLFGALPRIELFARKQTQGWDSYGNEAPDSIDLT